MGFIFHLLSIFIVAAKRLANNLGLTFCIAAGLTAAVALAIGIPIYSDAVNSRMLREELGREGRPPFAFMFWHVGSWSKPVEWDEFKPVDDYIAKRSPHIIGLPLEMSIRHVATDVLRLFPTEGSEYPSLEKALDWTSLGFIEGVEERINILEGRFPQPSEAPEGTVEVLATQYHAEKIGFQVGEEFILFGEEADENTGQKRQIQIPIRISGIWLPKDERDPFWFYPPKAFEKTFLVSEATFINYVAPKIADEVYKAVWYLVFDGSNVHIEDIPDFLDRVTIVRTQIASILDETTIEISPVKAMQKYQEAAFHLTILLYVFSIPVLGLVLYFISLISSMVVERQRNEIALLRSRGTSSLQVVGIYILEGILIGAIAVALGTVLGRTLAQLMGNTHSFLRFVIRPPLPTRISKLSLSFALAAMALALIASLIPALSASKHTIVTYKRERARSLQRPIWQRYFLDYFLLVPLTYGYYTLRQRGTIELLGRGEVLGDPFKNPILFLVPTLFVFTMALIFIRLFPILMEVLARLSERQRGAPLVLALRHLARSSRHYAGPLLLVILTIGLASFTASMARTLDDHLVDKVYYETGGDFKLWERGDYIGGEAEGGFGEMGMGSPSPRKTSRGEAEEKEEEEPHWEFIPVFEYLNVPGVLAATRVADYKAEARWSDTGEGSHIIGVDSEDFPKVAFFRNDFSKHPLTALMNTLSSDESAVLVERNFFLQNKLQVGNKIQLSVNMLGGWKEMEFTVAGALDYFPTAYPEDGPFFIANLDYLFSQAGGMYSYDVWLKVEEGVGAKSLEEGFREWKLMGSIRDDAKREIAREQNRPERQGFFGLLSVGFVSAALLTALGFLIYALISFQRRSIELGVLRAIGLSIKQMIAFLAGEQLSLISMGAATGTLLGIVTSALFIPFLQVGSGEHAQTPPFIVQIAWFDISRFLLIFGAMLIGVIAIMVWFLIRMKIFQAVKLEEVT